MRFRFCVVASLLAMTGCREEPTIVIKFEPNDLSGGVQVVPKVVDAGAVVGAAAVEKKAAAECKVAADCVVVPLDCCDCANGGKQHAVNKKAAAAAKIVRAERCAGTMCTQMFSTDPSCGQRADCVAGACVMAAAKKTKR